MKRAEYCIVTSTHHADFAEKVQRLLDSGWEFRGDTRVFQIEDVTIRFVAEFTRERRS